VTNRLALAAATLFGLAAAMPALAQALQFQLNNNSALALVELYTSPVSNPHWGDDLLGSRVVYPGESGTVTIADGATECVYDLQFVFEDGQVLEDRVDMCRMASYTLQ
jgi:hypothetical protein